MSIKYERPSERRMMMHFDRNFLDMLPTFKKGFQGNETGLLRDEVLLMKLGTRKNLRILDVGSADGDWLGKTTSIIWDKLDLHKAHFTAMEPVEDNPKLLKFCKDYGVERVPSRLEESQLKNESFDIITSTHSAYYYYNQPLAHEELFRLLKPGGKLIVTLVSQFCVLNRLTEELLGPHRQFALNAESYITMVSKLGFFSLERVVSFRGGAIDRQFYMESNDNLKALEYVLARHRLPMAEAEHALGFFDKALQRHHPRHVHQLGIVGRRRPRLGGETARRIISECRLKDETATWRRIADAVLDAMDVAYRRAGGR